MNNFKIILIILSAYIFLSAKTYSYTPNEDTFFHVKVEGTELPVLVKGNISSKKLIIFINGGPGLSSIDVARADMFGWSSGLEENFAMVYYDQRGCGNSQGNFDRNTITISQFVKDLDAIISVIKYKYDNPSVFLMGHSFGSFIGVNYLLTDNFQSNVNGWISIDGAYNFDYNLSWQYRRSFLINIANEEIAQAKNIKHWNKAIEWSIKNPVISTKEQKNELREFIGWPGGIIIPEESASLKLRDYLAIGFYSSYNPFTAYLSSNLKIVNDKLSKEAEGINLISKVSALTLPSLLIWGRYDDMIVPEEGLEVFNNFGTSQADKSFKILNNSSHEPFLSDAENFKRELIEFVRKY